MTTNHEADILFWGRVLAPILFIPPDDDRSERQILLSISSQEHIQPNGHGRRYSLSTLKRKLKRYKEQGIEGFSPALRSDDGSIRQGREASLQRAIELKRENPFRSHVMINLVLRDEGLEELPPSTLNRQLSRHGITIKKLGYDGTIIRKRWSREHTHSLWVGDFSQGPSVLDEHGVSHKTWNSAFIDAHSRFVVVSIYALTCDMDALVRSMLAAFEQHGKPKALYLDNAKVYHSPVLARACLTLGIELIHRTVRDPQGGGLIERFFLTAQKQFESELVGKKKVPPTLAELNQIYQAWLGQVYHKSRHSETRQDPVRRYTDGLLLPVCPLRHEEARSAFYNEAVRRVNKDFCDISLDNRRYRVDEKLRGDKVIIRYPLGDPGETVDLYPMKGRKPLGTAVLHDRSERVMPSPPPLEPDPTDYGAILLRLQAEDDQSKPLPKTPRYQPWSISTFITKLCAVTGQQIGSLSNSDLETLAKVHRRRSDLGLQKLKSEWARCEPPTLQQLLLLLCQEGPSS